MCVGSSGFAALQNAGSPLSSFVMMLTVYPIVFTALIANLAFEKPAVTVRTVTLTLRNSAFCTQCVYAPYYSGDNINRLDVVMDAVCSLCGTNSFYILLCRAMAEGASRRPLIAERSGFDLESVPVRLVVDVVRLGQFFVAIASVFHCVSCHQCASTSARSLGIPEQYSVRREYWRVKHLLCVSSKTLSACSGPLCCLYVVSLCAFNWLLDRRIVLLRDVAGVSASYA